MEQPKLIVVFSPHPDDEVIACAGSIVKEVSAGSRVKVVFATDGAMSHAAVLGIDSDPSPAELAVIRQEEAKAAGRVMGVKAEDILFLGFRDTLLAKSRAEFRAAVTAFLADHPDVDEIYLPHEVRELNADHRVTGEEVVRVLKELDQAPRLFRYVVWDEQTEAEFVFANREPTTQAPAAGEQLISVDIAAQLPRKLEALQQHRTQVTLYSPAQTRPVVPEAFVTRVCTRDVEQFWIDAG